MEPQDDSPMEEPVVLEPKSVPFCQKMSTMLKVSLFMGVSGALACLLIGRSAQEAYFFAASSALSGGIICFIESYQERRNAKRERLELWPDRIDHHRGKKCETYRFDEVIELQHREPYPDAEGSGSTNLRMHDDRRLDLQGDRWPLMHVGATLREFVIPRLRDRSFHAIDRGDALPFHTPESERVVAILIIPLVGILAWGFLACESNEWYMRVFLGGLCGCAPAGFGWYCLSNRGTLLTSEGIRQDTSWRHWLPWSDVGCVYYDTDESAQETMWLLDDAGRIRVKIHGNLVNYLVLREMLDEFLPAETPWYEVHWWQVGTVGRIVEWFDRLRTGRDPDYPRDPADMDMR